MHLHLDGKRFRVSTKIKVTKNNWLGHKAKSNKVMYAGKPVNKSLGHCAGDLLLASTQLTSEGGDISQLKVYYTALMTGKRTIKSNGKEFMPYFKLECEAQAEAGNTAASHYKCTYNTLVAYLKGTSPSFDQINLNFYKSFTRWCETDRNYMVSTISGHIKWIKTIMGKSYDEGLHKSEQFRKFKRESYTVDKIALSKIELDKIAYTVLFEKCSLVRDYFLLSCYTGARVSDWSKFRTIPKVGKIWSYTANKTKEKAKVLITAEIRAILEQYDYNLPTIEVNQTLNENIRKVCEYAGITENYTTSVEKGGKLVTETAPRYTFIASHTGRRTFTTINILDGMPVHLVMLQTGHKSLVSLEGYIRLKELQSTKALEDWSVTV
jgi:integrase